MFRSHSLEFLRERLWFALFSVFTLIVLALYLWLGADAFFITGPALLFFIAISQFPRILIWKWSLDKEHNPQLLRLKKIAKNKNTPEDELPHLYITEHSPIKTNICLLATGKSHWLVAHPDFIKTLSDDSLAEILTVTQELFTHSVIQRSSLLSALQCFLFFLPWSHHRGNELCFYSLHKKAQWSRLLYEQSLLSSSQPTPQTKVARFLAPTLLFPVLANYNRAHYYILYVHLRNQWVQQLKNALQPAPPQPLQIDLQDLTVPSRENIKSDDSAIKNKDNVPAMTDIQNQMEEL